mgnify:CR=1 FL=1
MLNPKNALPLNKAEPATAASALNHAQRLSERVKCLHELALVRLELFLPQEYLAQVPPNSVPAELASLPRFFHDLRGVLLELEGNIERLEAIINQLDL